MAVDQLALAGMRTAWAGEDIEETMMSPPASLVDETPGAPVRELADVTPSTGSIGSTDVETMAGDGHLLAYALADGSVHVIDARSASGRSTACCGGATTTASSTASPSRAAG
jgi:hypothetical protein